MTNMEFSLIEKHLRPSYYKKQNSSKMSYIGLSPQTYFHFLSYIDDDYLTDWEVMKFRTIFKTKMTESYVVPVGLTAFFYLTANRFLRLYAHRIVFYRGLKIVIALNFSVISYVLMNCHMWPNKQLHEIVTQPEPNGQYIRNILKDNYPRHWGMMSKQLHGLGYNFREMNEYSQKVDMPDVTDKFDNTMY